LSKVETQPGVKNFVAITNPEVGLTNYYSTLSGLALHLHYLPPIATGGY